MSDPQDQQPHAETSNDSAQNPMDEWAQALQEQNAQAQVDTAAVQPNPAQVFKPLDSAAPTLGEGFDIDMIKDIPVQLSVELGRARVTIRELLQLNQGSVVELSNLAGEPMDIFINGYLIAQGEVVVVGDSYGVRLTDIVTPSERLSRLSQKR